MKKRNLISVIIPLHEVQEGTNGLYKNAIQSVIDQVVKPSNVLVVTPIGSEATKFANDFDYGTI